MPAYNFKERFAADVEAGRKNNTIRPRRQRPTKKGDTLKLYTGQRTSKCRLLGETVCTDVVPVEIHFNAIRAKGKWFSVAEVIELASADGFNRLSEFYDFFIETYGLSHDYPLLDMEMICWEPLGK